MAVLKESGVILSYSIVLKVCAQISDIDSLICWTTLIVIPSLPGAQSPFIFEIILFTYNVFIILKYNDWFELSLSVDEFDWKKCFLVALCWVPIDVKNLLKVLAIKSGLESDGIVQPSAWYKYSH